MQAKTYRKSIVAFSVKDWWFIVGLYRRRAVVVLGGQLVGATSSIEFLVDPSRESYSAQEDKEEKGGVLHVGLPSFTSLK